MFGIGGFAGAWLVAMVDSVARVGSVALVSGVGVASPLEFGCCAKG